MVGGRGLFHPNNIQSLADGLSCALPGVPHFGEIIQRRRRCKECGGGLCEREKERKRESARETSSSPCSRKREFENFFFFSRQVLRRLVQRSAPTALPGSSLVRQSRRARERARRAQSGKTAWAQHYLSMEHCRKMPATRQLRLRLVGLSEFTV